MRLTRTVVLVLATLAVPAGLIAACAHNDGSSAGPAERAGAKVDEGGRNIEDAGKGVADAASGIGK